MNDIVKVDADFPESLVLAPHPPEFDRAPPWARALWQQQRDDRHHANNQLQILQGAVDGLKREQESTNDKLGHEPDSDGKGGKGLIGDVRKMGRDVGSLMDLRNRGLGFIAAIGLTGALIILGVIHWVQQVTSTAK